MRPLLTIFTLAISLGLAPNLSAQILVPINPAERRLIWLIEMVRLSGTQKVSRDEMLKLVDQGLDQFINFESLSRDMLGPHAATYPAADFAEFKARFRKVLQLTILVQSRGGLQSIPLNLVKDSLYGDPNEAVFQFTPAGENLSVRIGITFDPSGKYLKDILLNNDSLVRQYREMFDQIIKKYGNKGLLKLLEKKAEELEKQGK